MKKTIFILAIVGTLFLVCLNLYLKLNVRIDVGNFNDNSSQKQSDQCQDVDVSGIQNKVKAIEEREVSFKSKSQDIIGESAEGGEQVKYYDSGNLVLIKQTFYGETGKSEVKYFLDNDQVFHLIKKDFFYSGSIYIDSSGDIASEDIAEFYLDGNQMLCMSYKNQQKQVLDQETKELVSYLISRIQN